MQKHFGDQEQNFLMWFRPYIYLCPRTVSKQKKKNKKNTQINKNKIIVPKKKKQKQKAPTTVKQQ